MFFCSVIQTKHTKKKLSFIYRVRDINVVYFTYMDQCHFSLRLLFRFTHMWRIQVHKGCVKVDLDIMVTEINSFFPS